MDILLVSFLKCQYIESIFNILFNSKKLYKLYAISIIVYKYSIKYLHLKGFTYYCKILY